MKHEHTSPQKCGSRGLWRQKCSSKKPFLDLARSFFKWHWTWGLIWDRMLGLSGDSIYTKEIESDCIYVADSKLLQSSDNGRWGFRTHAGHSIFRMTKKLITRGVHSRQADPTAEGACPQPNARSLTFKRWEREKKTFGKQTGDFKLSIDPRPFIS